MIGFSEWRIVETELKRKIILCVKRMYNFVHELGISIQEKERPRSNRDSGSSITFSTVGDQQRKY